MNVKLFSILYHHVIDEYIQARYVKRFKLNEVNFDDLFTGPIPNFVKSMPKKVPKQKEKGVIDLTGEDEIIKQRKKQMKEQKQAAKQKKKGLCKCRNYVTFAQLKMY